jgi:hypothetical protein
MDLVQPFEKRKQKFSPLIEAAQNSKSTAVEVEVIVRLIVVDSMIEVRLDVGKSPPIRRATTRALVTKLKVVSILHICFHLHSRVPVVSEQPMSSENVISSSSEYH